jgi:hypothetical protein
VPYELPLSVDVTDASGVKTRVVVHVPAEARATVELPGHYATPPRALSYDPDEKLLARIRRL